MECQYSCTIIFLVIFYFTLHSIQTPSPIYICSDSWPLNAPLHCRSCAPYDNLVISIGSCSPDDNSVPILLLFWSTPPLLSFKQSVAIWLDAKLLCITKSSIWITPWKSWASALSPLQIGWFPHPCQIVAITLWTANSLSPFEIEPFKDVKLYGNRRHWQPPQLNHPMCCLKREAPLLCSHA